MDLPDAQAAGLAARGDADAFMVLVRRYRAPLIGYIHGRTRRRHEAEDIAQEAFCKAWEHLPRLRDPEAFAGWLFRIASNVVVTAGRRPRPVPLESEPVADPGPDPLGEKISDVQTAVADLDELYRTVVMLRHFSGLSTDQVASALGVPAGTVRSRLSRAYQQLRGRLAERVEV